METIAEKDLALELEMTYTKDPLYELWFLPVKDFLSKNINKSWEGKSGRDITLGINLEKIPQKTELAIICANFYSNKTAVLDFYKSQPEPDKKILEKGTWQESISCKELEEIYGQPAVFVEKVAGVRYYGDTYRLVKNKIFKRWHPFMVIRDKWNDFSSENAAKFLEKKNPKIIFPELMRKVLSNALPKPEGYFLKPVKPPEEIIIFNAEEIIFRELPLITTYYLQNKITYSQKGYPNAVTARKMAKTLRLKPFPIEGDNALRALMIAGLFDGFKMASISESPLNVLKHLFNRNFVKKPPAPFLLPHLKGVNFFHYEDFNGQVTPDIFQIFKDMPTENWVTFENIKQFASTHFINLIPLSQWKINKLSIDFGTQRGYGRVMDDVKPDNHIAIPYLAGHIFLLAAFGLMEISIDEDAPLNYSYYDGLQACRLTGLGAYMLGLKKAYALPESDLNTKLSFDENSPVIRIEGDILLGDTMMNDYAVKVSGNRYQFSPEKFLRNCKSTNELENKIALFKQTINQKLPAFWENYLQQLISNSKDIHSKSNMRVFKLPPENKELHRIIAQDNDLRNIIIKAEGFHILVEERQTAAFVNRMKTLGYLIG
ncbi:MAG: hypothetical protein M3Z92_02490 [Bacteroidota bacterium]|nr:hypothetical protein [Bacteroidota bacterium]